MKNVTYAGIVPLIGGMMFGAEKATGKKPEYILSYPAFGANDGMLLDYCCGDFDSRFFISL